MAPPHLLFALPAPNQTVFDHHHIQDIHEATVLALDAFSQFPGRDFLGVNPSTKPASASILAPTSNRKSVTIAHTSDKIPQSSVFPVIPCHQTERKRSTANRSASLQCRPS